MVSLEVGWGLFLSLKVRIFYCRFCRLVLVLEKDVEDQLDRPCAK
jgi:hypothetical protein